MDDDLPTMTKEEFDRLPGEPSMSVVGLDFCPSCGGTAFEAEGVASVPTKDEEDSLFTMRCCKCGMRFDYEGNTVQNGEHMGHST